MSHIEHADCRTCDFRAADVASWPSAPSQINISVISLKFAPAEYTESTRVLNALLNNIVDHEMADSRPSTFTVWSPCSEDKNTFLLLTTLHEICHNASSPIFDSIRDYLTGPPTVSHAYLDQSVVSLAASGEQRLCCDIIQIHAPTPEVSRAMGRHFGWEPKRHTLSRLLEDSASVGFSRPGDLIRDFRAWTETNFPFDPPRSLSRSTTGSSLGSCPSQLSVVSDQTMSWDMGSESLLMIFQWSNRSNAKRFKDPRKKSYGANGVSAKQSMWEEEVAFPMELMERTGAEIEFHQVELRAVEPRMETDGQTSTKERRRSKRMSFIADKVTALWKSGGMQ